MRTKELAQTAAWWTAAGTAAAVTLYAAYVSVAWVRYGRVYSRPTETRDALLDGFMPTYEIREHHDIRVAAPADMTLAVARNVDVLNLPVVRALVKGRELIIGGACSRRFPTEKSSWARSRGHGTRTWSFAPFHRRSSARSTSLVT